MKYLPLAKWMPPLFAALSIFGFTAPAHAQTIQLNIMYVHGVQNSPTGKTSAQNSLKDLETAVNTALAPKISAYQTAHPGVTVTVKSVRVNLYTATPSPYHPSNSTGTAMDDWTIGAGCGSTVQGHTCTTAYEWRWRLANQIIANFGSNAKNVILVGHSTGARTAMEVAANMGPNGVGSQNWGVQGMIAGVVTAHGMLDALNSGSYNFIGWSSFDFGCKNGGYLLDVINSGSAPGKGWCEYAGRVSGFPAADWVARNKSAMMLTGWASCSPSLWTGWSDGSLPFAAQGSALAVGASMTPGAGQTYVPSHGEFYGSYCHSDISNGNSANHTSAVNAATNKIANWIFNSAPRVEGSGSLTTPVIYYGQTTSSFSTGGSCPVGRVNGPAITVVGDCTHPGYFDGDDHPISQYPAEVTATTNSTCSGSFKWKQNHDSNNGHAAKFWYKSYSLPPGGGLINILSAS